MPLCNTPAAQAQTAARQPATVRPSHFPINKCGIILSGNLCSCFVPLHHFFLQLQVNSG